ncbi:MAG TPA: hypothetical protein VHB69_09070 [Mycobacteriales bacterium]|nr:hypothetical protein [Mycobacteriales bacterium]
MSPRHLALEHGSDTLADLVADARAIPAAAYGAGKRVIDLAEPARAMVIAIPEATAAAFADFAG